jgi:hypothetical protein
LKLTFVDAGVLIAAARGTDLLALQAMKVLDDPERSFASSPFVRLEVQPKALFHRRTKEAAFYEAFFDAVRQWAAASEDLVQHAHQHAIQYGLSALDALHVAAAVSLGAEELVTSERPDRPIHRVTTIVVRTIQPS